MKIPKLLVGIIAAQVIMACAALTLVGAIIYVAWHFIHKAW